MSQAVPDPVDGEIDWHRRVVGRSLKTAQARSIDRGAALIRAAAALLERSDGDGFTVQDVADEAKQSLRTLYQYFESKDDLLLAVFEEAMRTYARMVEAAIVDLVDPLERLGGALLAAGRLPEFSGTGVNGGLARLRLKLSEVDADLVGRAQAPVTSLLRRLIDEAVANGDLRVADPESATFLLRSLITAVTTSTTLGNDVGAGAPPPTVVASFCLHGLGARLAPDWFDDVSARLRLPAGPLSMTRAPIRR